MRFLEALRPQIGKVLSRFYADPDCAAARDARILTVLEKRVPLHFSEPTSLKDVLMYIRAVTSEPEGRAIPIYVDPIGLAEADRTSKIRNFDLEDVELRTSLRLLLEQLDLGFTVKDGLLLITSQDSLEFNWTSIEEDAYQTVGHCILALFAAVLGGFSAPLVCGLTAERRRASGGTVAG